MESRPSRMGGPLGRGASCLTTLLAASILSSCFLLAEGQATTIQLLPLHPREGQNVTLTPTPRSDVDKSVACFWYRGLTTDQVIYSYYPASNIARPGIAATRQETVGPGCVLHIMNVTSGDTGNFTVHLTGPAINVKVNASVVVSEILPSPVLNTSAQGLVEENTNVTLNCITSNSVGVRVTWFKDEKPLPAGADLSDRDQTLTLTHVSKSDTGLYRCNASNIVSNVKSNSVNITVAYGPVIQLNPEGPIEKSLNSDLKLECSADSVPAAQFQWFFNNTEQDANSLIFQVRLSNWTDEGNYACQATNPSTNRTATKSVYVKLTEDPAKSSVMSPGATAGIIVGCLAITALIVGALLYVFLYARGQRDKTSTQAIDAPTTYENVFPFTQVKTDSSAQSNNVYETLQHSDQSVYQQLKGSKPSALS